MSKGKRILAIMLAGALAVGTLGGCGQSEHKKEDSTQKAESIQESDNTPLVIAERGITQNFSPFFAETQGDRNVSDLTSAYLLGKDRNGEYVLQGIEGETRNYNHTDYPYWGISDCAVKKGKNGNVSYTFTLRDGVLFSDGTPLTADDLIFTMYVYLDPAYDGPVELNQLPITGLKEYIGNSYKVCNLMLQRGESNENFDQYSKKKQKKFFKTYWPKAKKEFISDILAHYGTKSIAKAMIALGYAYKDDETGVVTATYSYKRWTMKEDDKPTTTDFWDELKLNSAYGNDIESMSDALVQTGIVREGVFEHLPEYYRKTIDIGEKNYKYIKGIKKVDDRTVKVTLSEYDSTALQKLAIPVEPLHYYGNTDAYNYKKHSFGFEKGDLSSMKKLSSQPMGAGPYVYVGYSDDAAYLEANPYYWKGAPSISMVRVMAMSESDMAYSLVEGAADIAEPSISREDLDQIRKINSNGSENGDIITTTFTDYNAFGYVGFNAQKVRVGVNGLSKESVYLRRAIATVLAFYRFSSVHDYYGDTAKLIDYGISSDAWASFKKWETDYEEAYRTDINGKLIYTSDMTYSERKAAVLKASLDYFEAAGYTVKKGKIKEAPAGASREYELMITGYGSGDHPSFALVTDAAKALKKIGFKLKITDVSDSSDMFMACQSGNVDMWVAAWPAEDDLDSFMYTLYHSKGGSAYMFSLYSRDMDDVVDKIKKTSDQEKRRKYYRKCLQYLSYYTVEVPTYQRQNCILFSTQRIDTDTLPADQTSNYNWRDEIATIRMR